MNPEYDLELSGITKRFGATLANDHIHFGVKKGEVHSLIGENGAGKSTLMNILYGLLRPDEGEIRLGGKPLVLRSPKDAIANGIGMVHQHFMLSPSLTVAENIVLGHRPPGQRVLWKPREMERHLEAIRRDFDVDLPLDAPVSSLTVGLMQRIEIVKTLYRGAKILILDEPTAVLTPQESEELFHTVRKLSQAGHTVIFISHKLREVMEISDRITVLRAGRSVDTVNKSDVTPRLLAQMMNGREIRGLVPKDTDRGPVALSVEDLAVPGDRGTLEVRGLSFELRMGEILGVAGVEGNGQTELAEAVIGVRRPAAGRIQMQGEEITRMPVGKRFERGLAHIPQARVKGGLILDFPLTDNLVLSIRNGPPVSKHGVIDWRAAQTVSRKLIADYQIKASSPEEACKNLSGGNMQKVVVARELSKKPRVIIACQPTRGVDIGASEYIRRMLMEMRDAGNAVLLISADLDEVMELSDRIMVMYGGRKTGELLRAEADEHKLGRMMFGITESEEAEG